MTTTFNISVALFAVTIISGPAQAGPDESVPQPTVSVAGPEAAAPGLKVFIDPQTGAIRPDPAPGTEPLVVPPQQQNSFSTSHEGLTEVPGSEPGGGVKLDLKGRFQSPLVATIDENGKVKMEHLGEPSESHDPK